MMTDIEPIPTTDDPDGPSRMTRVWVIVVVVAVGGLLLAAGAWGAARYFSVSTRWDVEAGIEVEVVIDSGTSATAIYRMLDDARVAPADELESAATGRGVEARLRAGTYALTTDMDPEAVIDRLVAGPEVSASSRFVVVEGWTVDRIVDEVASRLEVTRGEVQRVLRSDELTAPYLPPEGGPVDRLDRWEGLLAPATYPVGPNTRPDALLQSMASEATRRLDALDWSRIEALGVTPYEAITIASLVEREAGTDAERDEIASVIYNRLDAGMRLQIDATVIYALGYNPGRLTGSDLELVSPWNTYRVDGLPPTPIGTPSVASLEAATHPAATEYLFYVLGSDDGSHLFASTYEGHQENIETARAAGVLP